MTDEDAAGSLLADGEPSTRAVFMVDPSAEAEHVAQLLRGMGCVVVDVPMSMLVARIAVQKPRVVIMDADVKEAADTVKTVRAMPGGTTIALVLLGQEKPPVEEGHASVGATSDAFFRRPIDPALVVQTVVAHAAEAPSHASESVAPTSAPTSSVPAKPPASARGWPWAAADRRSPVPAGIGSSGRQISARPPPNVGVRDTSVAVNAVISIQSPLSAELEMLLLDAEQRLTSQSLHEPAPPSPDEELEAVLPAELLAALDEPIEDDAEDFALDAGLSRGEAEAAVGSGAVPAPTNAGRALTPAPAISVGPMTIAGSAFAAAVVQQRAVAPTLAPPIRSLARNHGEQAISSDVVPGATGAASLPTTALTAGDAPRVLAEAIVSRQSGALSFESPGALRRVVVRDGDIVAAASSAEDETLLAFMTARGDVRGEHVKSLVGKIPPFGRHAGAALVGHGLLRQDQLWPALRAHSEWLISRVLALTSGTARLEPEPQGRLRSEPGVFGGSSGAEVLVELARRVVPSDEAIRLLGGPGARLAEGPAAMLLSECALAPEDRALLGGARGLPLGDVLARARSADLASVVYMLSLLGVLSIAPGLPAHAIAQDHAGASDDIAREEDIFALDLAAVRERVRARLDLVSEADYFALLGVPRTATGYDIRRAFLELRRAFEPARILTPEIADLSEDVRTIVSVLDEAYEVLRDATRRERYRRALVDAH